MSAAERPKNNHHFIEPSGGLSGIIDGDLRFRIKDCDLAALATGRKAQNLREMREILSNIRVDSLYFHFWGSLLKATFDDPEHHNDFAAWAWYGLHDSVLAEKLGIIDPADFDHLEDLREALLEIIEAHLDELETVPAARIDHQFHFIRSQIVVFDTGRIVDKPEDLADVLPTLSLGSIFFHVIDARRRSRVGRDDFQAWLEGSFPGQCDELCREIGRIDPFFGGLARLRTEYAALFENHFRRQS